ncbi:hypothetical protein KM176_17990 [Pseudooceanicola sp. CBS1P-1]|uniref:Uncharacterized protein n=1 Tax=Pseudooceanicola albus TaxID=2692189 RepID=A0A6L7G7T8_9RHOB|nr:MULTISPECIES: hypothetical protein [Pseudooceanicola]MBT9385767.1 hypothetical protein [Pseudooceanicola endophyticus]MXN19999.1 hypothetical protein [Pseudooceanicola albus]
MKRAASLMTALLVATSAGAAAANTDVAAYTNEMVPASVLYSSPRALGPDGSVLSTSGIARLQSAALSDVPGQGDQSRTLTDPAPVTGLPD